jgi:formylmethanofuran dehydrogenase subunit D
MLIFAYFLNSLLNITTEILLVRSKGMVDQKLKVTLITGRTIDQGVGKERGKGSKEYFENASLCFIDQADMQKLGIRNRTNVRVSTRFGAVIVKGIKQPRGANPGMIFMPCGSWANVICGDDTYAMGMPLFKGFPAEVEPAPDEPVLKLEELLLKEYGRSMNCQL